MKIYRAVIKKVEETNYKKGITRIDTNSSFYKTGKVLYYIAFAWFMFFQTSYLFSNTAAFLFFKKAAENIHESLYITSLIVFFMMIAGFVFIKLKQHVVAFVLNTAAAILQMSALHKNEMVSLAWLEHGFLSNKYFWFHYAPAILIILFALIIGIVGVKSYIEFKRDYKVAMNSMYTAYLEEHPNTSDIEWQEYLEKLDAEKEDVKNLKRTKKRK